MVNEYLVRIYVQSMSLSLSAQCWCWTPSTKQQRVAFANPSAWIGDESPISALQSTWEPLPPAWRAETYPCLFLWSYRCNLEGGNGSAMRYSQLVDMRSFPSFLTQNHLERYDEFDGSVTPASILRCNTSHTCSWMPGGIGIFRCAQGLCGTTGISMGGKKSSLRIVPCEFIVVYSDKVVKQIAFCGFKKSFFMSGGENFHAFLSVATDGCEFWWVGWESR